MTLEQKARELTDYFFTSGADEKATHLRLAIEDGENHWKHLGGWGRLPFQEAVKASLATVAADAVREQRKKARPILTEAYSIMSLIFYRYRIEGDESGRIAEDLRAAMSKVQDLEKEFAPYQPQEEK